MPEFVFIIPDTALPQIAENEAITPPYCTLNLSITAFLLNDQKSDNLRQEFYDCFPEKTQGYFFLYIFISKNQMSIFKLGKNRFVHPVPHRSMP